MSTVAPQRPLLTVREAAERLAVSEKTIRRRIAEGAIPAVRVGTAKGQALRIDPAELEAWLYGSEAA